MARGSTGSRERVWAHRAYNAREMLMRHAHRPRRDRRRRPLRPRARGAELALADRAAGAPPRRARLRAASLSRSVHVSAAGGDRARRRPRGRPDRPAPVPAAGAARRGDRRDGVARSVRRAARLLRDARRRRFDRGRPPTRHPGSGLPRRRRAGIPRRHPVRPAAPLDRPSRNGPHDSRRRAHHRGDRFHGADGAAHRRTRRHHSNGDRDRLLSTRDARHDCRRSAVAVAARRQPERRQGLSDAAAGARAHHPVRPRRPPRCRRRRHAGRSGAGAGPSARRRWARDLSRVSADRCAGGVLRARPRARGVLPSRGCKRRGPRGGEHRTGDGRHRSRVRGGLDTRPRGGRAGGRSGGARRRDCRAAS